MGLEFLKGILTDATYDAVVKELDGNDKVKLVNLASGEYVAKAKYDADMSVKDQKINELTDTVKQFDGVDVKKLQDDVKNWSDKYKKDMADLKLQNAIDLACSEAHAKNTKMLKSQLDMSIIKLNDDGTLAGYQEQLEKIKKENAFLFDSEPPKDPKDPIKLGGSHGGSGGEKITSLKAALAEHYNK